MFETKQLTKRFGGLYAVSSLNLKIDAGEIVGLIGPNGAGKTTVFNLVTGFIRPTSGRVIFRGEDLIGQRPHIIAAHGICRTFQIAKLFPDFTVLENMTAAAHLRTRTALWRTVLRTAQCRKRESKAIDRAIEILGFVGLDAWKDSLAGTLPHAHQKLLATAMGLSTEPKLLLLDEPLEGSEALRRLRVLWGSSGKYSRGESRSS